MLSVTLFEGMLLLIITGVFVVAWWGVKRLVKTNDDGAILLDKINKSLSIICERLGKSDTWMELHSKQDDDRHEEIKSIFGDLWSAVDKIRKV